MQDDTEARGALDLYSRAKNPPFHPSAVGWEQIADKLAAALSATLDQIQPKAAKRPAKAAPLVGWSSYTAAQVKGPGSAFVGGLRATFTFADGRQITTGLFQRANMGQPDWERACRCAISFYRTKRAGWLLDTTVGRATGPAMRNHDYPKGHTQAYDDAPPVGSHWGTARTGLTEQERESIGCAVPDFTACTSDTDQPLDIARANAATAELRAGSIWDAPAFIAAWGTSRATNPFVMEAAQ